MNTRFNLALLVSAFITTAAFGQKVDVVCPSEECHVAPVFKGSGGFVGEIAEGFDEVALFMSCGNRTVSIDDLEPESDGVVRRALDDDNGLACHDKAGGVLRIHGLQDGGWYWIIDGMNAAVSPLIAKDVLDNEQITPTDPGGVTLTASDWGTVVKDEGTGLIGIIPHIVPEPPMEAADPCAPEWNQKTRSYDQVDTDCMLGDGETMIVLTTANARGTASTIGSTIHRRTVGDVEVGYGLYGNGSGHLASPPELGWNIDGGEAFAATFSADPQDPTLSLAAAGLELTNADTMPVDEPVPAPTDADGDLNPTDFAADGDEAGNYVGDSDDDGTADCIVRTTLGDTDNDPDTADVITHYWFKAATNDLEQRYVRVLVNDASNPPATTLRTGTPTTYNLADADVSSAWVVGYNNAAENDVNIDVRQGISEDGASVVNTPQVACRTERMMKPVAGGILISPSSTLCSRTSSRSVTVDIVATGARGMNPSAMPEIAESTKGVNAVTSLTIACPASSSSSNQGQELVPGNPFPTGE